MLLKGNRFQDMDEIKRNTMTWVLAFPKSQFKKCFRQRKDRWNKCVVCEGTYFEGELEHVRLVSLFLLALGQILFDQVMYVYYL
jgi:hypothetical protein